mmetsp:Transcript_31207/g.47790  ORF Transcript_31207/g.47790 Transcript_31207/m.47790 type:complete len:84 (-) Transcript_31207:623-874(-)
MLLNEAEEKYEQNRPKKWMCSTLGLLIGACLGLGVPTIYSFMTNSLYDRNAIEGLMKELIGERNISEALFDEILIVAYEYNSQ